MKRQHTSVRVFQSDFLEKFTHVHPITPLVVWLPVVAWLIYRSFEVHGLSAASVGTVGALGFIFWTLAEYALHRWVFHFRANGYFQERLQFIIHGLHHEDPQDPTRLVMPPVAAVVIAAALFTIFRAVLGQAYVEPFFAFFLVGYLCYDYTHFWVHHYNPKSRVGRMIKQHHMLHHYATHGARWGVSSPVWDYVFGTVEETKKKEHKTA